MKVKQAYKLFKRPIIFIVLSAAVSLNTFCGKNITDVLYEPVITFGAWLEKNGSKDSVTFEGTLAYPNRCELDNDTLSMHFFSDDYYSTGSGISEGYQLWVVIYPLAPDTVDSLDALQYLETGDFLIRLSDRNDPQITYYLNRSDTAYDRFSATMEIEYLQKRGNGRIELKNINAPLHIDSQGSVSIRILDGVISGRVE